MLELAYLNGLLSSEADLLNLAQLYAERDAPYKAAQLLEKELQKGRLKANRKTWEQTANAWQLARETGAYRQCPGAGPGLRTQLGTDPAPGPSLPGSQSLAGRRKRPCVVS